MTTYYKLSTPSRISQRHPFQDFGAVTESAAKRAAVIRAPEGAHYEEEGIDPFDFDYRSIDRQFYQTVQGFGLSTGEVYNKAKEPILRGLISGFVTYGVAKSVGVVGEKAQKLGIVMGVVDAVVAFASEALIRGATATAPVASQTVQQPVTGFGRCR